MSRHLKSVNAPKSWNIFRKVTKYMLRPLPGAHPLAQAMPVGLVIRTLQLAQTRREINVIINNRVVSVDGKVVTDQHANTGFLDVIHVKPSTTVRCVLDEKGRMMYKPIKEAEANKKLCRITGKRTTKGGKIQVTLQDGRNVLGDKTYNVGDSLLIEIPSQKIVQHYALAPGNIAFLTEGKHTGKTGTIDKIEGDRIWCTIGKEKVETRKQFALVAGKDKPAITL